jgi:hypothetical protein
VIADRWLRRSLEAIDASTRGMTPAQLAWHPEGKWSSAEILEHLAKAYGSTAYILEKCVAERRTVASPPTWRQRVFAVAVVTAGYLPSGVEAPTVTRPDGLSPLEALAGARASLEALDVAARKSAAAFGARVPVANHPILGGFSTAQWQRFHWVHTRHHMRQIARRRRAQPPS